MPARIVLRGRRGSGRRTLAAALAARAGRRVASIELRAGDAAEAILARDLREVALRGWLACVSLDALADDAAARDRVRSVLDAHPAPLFVRTSLDQPAPLAPGHHVLELPALDEQTRADAWRSSLVQRGLPDDAAPRLAARFSIGPGVIARACDHPAVAGANDLEAALASAVRQQRATRMDAIATRIDRVATWSDLVLPDDIRGSLEELVGRVAHRGTVLERWGMERVATTARGVTALFQGAPGTGKTMAAGALASRLGYELWRVDLSRVMSRWLGETEKNLGAVFDAAEEGEIVLLFDEADSLFGKRTEVKSSNDRYANLEVNYLLQRLDSFQGVAVLTTNFGTAIDAAFKRRLSLHVEFPFPEEIDRERLWRTHLPPTLPTAGTFELAELARRFALSGGMIRNAALRAAYLAAGESRPLAHDHLIRAVELEYASRGKLGTGKLE